MTMKCWRCNEEIEIMSNFCRHCGAGQKRDIKFNDMFYDTPQQREFLELFGFEMPIDRKLSKEYRRPIPDMKEFERLFYLLYGKDCGYHDEPTLKGKVDFIYGIYAANWLEDQIPNIIVRETTEDDLDERIRRDMYYLMMHRSE